jgi:iron complex transport system substrate-binding protein
MHLDAARPKPRFARFAGVVTLLAAVLLVFALQAPAADAAKNKRVIAISPFAAQTMIQLGYKPYRVGMTLGQTNFQKRLFRNIPKMTLSHPNGPNLELVAKMRPALVLSSTRWSQGNKAMRRLGIRVVVADPLSPQAVKSKVSLIGRLLGRKKQARKLNKKITRQLNKAVSGIKGVRPKTLVVLGIGTTAMAFMKNSWGGRLVTMAGGNLVTGGASAKGGFARISDEVVLHEDPERIIVVPHGNQTDLARVAEWVRNNEVWKSTKAGQTGNIKVSGDNTLLQAGTDLGATVRYIRTNFLKNW